MGLEVQPSLVRESAVRYSQSLKDGWPAVQISSACRGTPRVEGDLSADARVRTEGVATSGATGR